MQWENLTSTDFAIAQKETGVCILPMGVLEKHSEHLPLGTDMLNSHKIACLAAEKEPAVVFPQWYFGQIYEAGCFPGTLTIPPGLLIELFTAVFDSIGRNGFRKIILYNGHGGNTHLVRFLAQSSLWEQKPYTLYLMGDSLTAAREKEWNSLLETPFHGHACECETSVLMANFPELAHPERIPAEPAMPLARLRSEPQSYTGIWWYGDHPDHYAGDARAASREKGLKLNQLMVDSLAEFIAAVKADAVAPALEQEFFRRKAAI